MNKFNNIFGQILDLFPKLEFLELVHETRSAWGTKGFSCWDQFVAMMFCQLGRANSLREICYGLGTYLGKIIHLGLKKPPSCSTLAYANEHRPWQLYQQLFYRLLERCRSAIGEKHKFRFKNKLLSFDATLISLCLEMFNWAKYRRAKGAIKLHLLLDHAGYLPKFVHITEGRVHEVNILRTLEFDPGTIVVYDRGLMDYSLLSRFIESGVYFVTRLKSNVGYKVIKQRRVPMNRSVLRDETIQFTGYYSREKCPYPLRLVSVWIEGKNEMMTFLTNNFELGSTTIAAIYKDRWQIETFFKILKQNLRIKTFVGTSYNAVLIQIWTALIALLILKYLKAKSKANWSLSNLVALLRYNLLTYRDLWEWINNPYLSPPKEVEDHQLSLLPT
ncbi:IS4 family transposase [bacterium]|nr:IS4 family transposase [bacterium]